MGITFASTQYENDFKEAWQAQSLYQPTQLSSQFKFPGPAVVWVQDFDDADGPYAVLRFLQHALGSPHVYGDFRIYLVCTITGRLLGEPPPLSIEGEDLKKFLLYKQKGTPLLHQMHHEDAKLELEVAVTKFYMWLCMTVGKAAVDHHVRFFSSTPLPRVFGRLQVHGHEVWDSYGRPSEEKKGDWAGFVPPEALTAAGEYLPHMDPVFEQRRSLARKQLQKWLGEALSVLGKAGYITAGSIFDGGCEAVGKYVMLESTFSLKRNLWVLWQAPLLASDTKKLLSSALTSIFTQKLGGVFIQGTSDSKSLLGVAYNSLGQGLAVLLQYVARFRLTSSGTSCLVHVTPSHVCKQPDLVKKISDHSLPQAQILRVYAALKGGRPQPLGDVWATYAFTRHVEKHPVDSYDQLEEVINGVHINSFRVEEGWRRKPALEWAGLFFENS